MMTGMSVSQMTKAAGAGMAAIGRCLRVFSGRGSDREVVMTRILTGLLAVAIVAASIFGAAMVGARKSAASGMMPEVVATAEMPRLVMPTVEVHAFRTVAMSFAVNNAN